MEEKKEYQNHEAEGCMIGSAYWSRKMFGEPETTNRRFSMFTVAVSSERNGTIKVWAHNEEEALSVLDNIPERDFMEHTMWHHVGQTAKIGDAANLRYVALVLNDQDGIASSTHIINIETALPDDKIIPAIQAACQDYLNTPEGRKTWEYNNHNFNYGDFDLYVSNEFCLAHAFRKAEKQTTRIICDDFNTSLGSVDEEPALTITVTGEALTITVAGNMIRVSDEGIDDIMDTVMCGCTYWCEKAKPVGGYLGEYTSDQINRGGTIRFYSEGFDPEELTMEKFRDGLAKWIQEQSADRLSQIVQNGWIDPGQIDADAADTILQYALFGEVRFS